MVPTSPKVEQPNALREGLIVGLIYGVTATVLVFVGAAFQEGGVNKFLAQLDVPRALGGLTGRSVGTGLLIAVLAAWRNGFGVTKVIFADWRFYVLAIFPLATDGGAILAWLWCGCIYQYRFTRRATTADAVRFAQLKT